MQEGKQCDDAGATIEMEIDQEDIRNCYALSVDKRIETIVDLTSDIEELLGLQPDKEYRMQRVQLFRQQAVMEGTSPTLDPEFSGSVEDYCNLLQSKKAILLSMFKCCEDFCLAMHKELETISRSFANNPEERRAFVQAYIRRHGSQSMKSSSRFGCPGKHQRRNRLPSHALGILWEFVRNHKKNPYPSTQQKEALARQTNLTMTQIRNWFTNTRKRKLSQSPESDEDYSIGSDHDESYPSPEEDAPYRRSKKRRSANRSSESSKQRARSFDLLPPLPPSFASLDPGFPFHDAADRSSSGTWIQYSEKGLFPSVKAESTAADEKETLELREPLAPLELREPLEPLELREPLEPLELREPGLTPNRVPLSPMIPPRCERDFPLLDPDSMPNSGLGFSLSQCPEDAANLGMDIHDSEFFNNNPLSSCRKEDSLAVRVRKRTHS